MNVLPSRPLSNYMAKKIALGILVVIVGFVAIVLAGFAWYPSLAAKRPEYKEATAICDSIKVGMTFDEVKSKVGELFFPNPMTYIDGNGNGQAQLKNDIKDLDATCLIKFESGQVISTGMSLGWL